MFNIGGEGQAYIGGLGVALVAFSVDGFSLWWIIFPLAIIAAIAGGVWAYIPAYLQAKNVAAARH